MPANDFYDSTGYPSNGSLGVAATMRSELDLIEAGFNKLPGLAASANLPIFGNSGGTALEPKSAADARTLLDVYSKAETPTNYSVPSGGPGVDVGTDNYLDSLKFALMISGRLGRTGGRCSPISSTWTFPTRAARS